MADPRTARPDDMETQPVRADQIRASHAAADRGGFDREPVDQGGVDRGGAHEAPDGAPRHPLIDLSRDPHPGQPDHARTDED